MSHSDINLDWNDSLVSRQACPICEAKGGRQILIVDRPQIHLNREPLHLFKCPACHSLYYEGEDVVRGYHDPDLEDFHWQHYVEVGAGIEAMIRPIIALGSRARGSLLDVGCAFGYVPHYWEVSGHGTAVGLETAAYGRMGRDMLGAEIYASYCADCAEIKNRKFDIVYSSEVIEHVPDPLTFLRELIGKLEPDGILVLTTPSADFIAPSKSASDIIAPLFPGYHYFLLSPRALRDLIGKAGLPHCMVKEVGVQLMAWASKKPLPPISIEIFDWDGYLDYLAKIGSNSNRNVAGGALYRLFKDSLNTGRAERAATAFSQLYAHASEQYGFDLFCIDVLKATAAATIIEQLKAAPAWLGGALLFGGVLNELKGGSPERGSSMLGSAILVLLHETLIGTRFSSEARSFLPYAQTQYNKALQRLVASADAAVPRQENDLCFFAHYDRDGRVADNVVHYVKELQSAHFDVVFVTTAAPSKAELEKVAPYTIDIIVRENAGFDFGSWIEAYRKHGARPTRLLLLCNDSVYGPMWGLNSVLGKLFEVEADFYGMAMSNEHRRHLQSWFLLFTPRAHQSEAFRKIMDAECAGLSKADVIEKLELGLTATLEEAGLRSHALFDMHTWRLPMKIAVNPSHFWWRELIETYGVPFIKIELLRDNPLQLKLSSAPGIVSRRSSGNIVQTMTYLKGPHNRTRLSIASRMHHAALQADYLLARAGWSYLQRLNLYSVPTLKRAFVLFFLLKARGWAYLSKLLAWTRAYLSG
jgi:SAM-dependent methyltransferase